MKPSPAETLIVGQGIAGTLMARRFEQAGMPFVVMDPGLEGSSSLVAAGIINPVTGRHMVKSWRFDELLPDLLQTYKDFENLLGKSFLQPSRVVRVLPSVGEENKWQLQASKSGYELYIAESADPSCFLKFIHPVHSFGEITNAFLVNWPGLLQDYRVHLQQTDRLIQEQFDFGRLDCAHSEGLRYGDRLFSRVIFCEGAAMRTNPWFGYLPMEAAKGEALLIRIPGSRFDAILKHRLLIAPWKDDLYWAGSNYERGATDGRPTQKTKDWLLERLRDIFVDPPEVAGHIAAIRPTVRDRRPLLGKHLKEGRLVVFNGLGTKGSSLAPFWSKQLMAHLFHGNSLDPEVDIRRFDHLIK